MKNWNKLNESSDSLSHQSSQSSAHRGALALARGIAKNRQSSRLGEAVWAVFCPLQRFAQAFCTKIMSGRMPWRLGAVTNHKEMGSTYFILDLTADCFGDFPVISSNWVFRRVSTCCTWLDALHYVDDYHDDYCMQDFVSSKRFMEIFAHSRLASGIFTTMEFLLLWKSSIVNK